LVTGGGSWHEIGSFVPARREGISQAEIDGELVLLDTQSGTLHVLDRVAAAVWSELDGVRSVDAIVEELSDAAEAETERVREDVARFLDQLARGGLLSYPPPSGAR
jgi:Coenzyme PQQ synthesis protein D (PqqD)